MTAREVIAYAITHAPPGVKGGPYEGEIAIGTQVHSLREATRWLSGLPPLSQTLRAIQKVHPHARVIRIVRAGPSEASATLETARRRLAAVAESMTEHAYQEMASALEVDACRVEPSEASAVEVLRELVAWWEAGPPTTIGGVLARARRVLVAAGPDPMPVVRAAMERRDACAAYHAVSARGGDDSALYSRWINAEKREDAAVDTYRKAGGK